MATRYQKLLVDHVPFPLVNGHSQAAPLDYDRLKAGGFGGIFFRPEEGVQTCALRINYCKGQGCDGNVWVADPISADSVAAGIPGGAIAWAKWVADFVAQLASAGQKPRILKLNVEDTGKGYPPWKALTNYPKWAHVVAKTPDQVYRLFVTATGGKSGTLPPNFTASGNTQDGQVVWYQDTQFAAHGYPYANGWQWNEVAAKTLVAEFARLGVTDVGLMAQPLSMQLDFNFGAWASRGARFSPQCYGAQPYLQLSDPGAEVWNIASNPYVPLYYNGLKLDINTIHPTIGNAQSWFYVPRLQQMRKDVNPSMPGDQPSKNCISIYRHDGFDAADYTAYKPFVIP